MKYKHKLKTKTKEKIAAHGYGNVKLKISNFKGNTNILIVTNVGWISYFDHNLLSTIFLAKKKIEVFLKKVG